MEYSPIQKISHSLHAMEKTRWAMSAFAALLADALAENTDYKNHTIGIAALLERQIDDLSEIEDNISENIDLLEAEILEAQQQAQIEPIDPVPSDDVDAISRLSGLHKAAVARVLYILTGTDAMGNRYVREGDFHPTPLPRHILERRVYETLKDWADLNRIQTEIGIEPDKLEAVLQSMVNFPPNAPNQAVENVMGQLLAESSQKQEEQKAVNA
ncbi:hypothetical protein ACLBWS_00105 [Brucellaceae bacterium D45D]